MLTLTPLSPEMVLALYHERMEKDFPPDELKTPELIMELINNERYCCFGAYLEEVCAGYAFFCEDHKKSGVYLLDYYAIREDLRGKGLGSQILALLTEQFAGAEVLLCEVENPYMEEEPQSRAEMTARMNFYLRNGWRDTKVDAWAFDVEYRLLAAPVGDVASPEQVIGYYRDIYKDVVDDARLKKKMRLRIANQM